MYCRAIRFVLFLIVFGLSLFGQSTSAQNIESIGSNLRNWKAINSNISGGLVLNSTFYTSNSIVPRRDPFTWSIMANLNFQVAGVNAPFAFIFSDGNQRFNLPSYSFTGISPTYKWATLHAGDRSMYFNRYTLSNINFRGGGLELTPGKWTIKTMYGRLRKASAEDLNARQSIDPAFERLGWGMLAGYSADDYSFTLALFHAHDREGSISTPINSLVTPADNMVISLSGRKAIGSHLVVDADFARSGYNADTRSGNESTELAGATNTFFGLFQPTNSASYGNAYNIGVTFTKKIFSVRLGTEKIDRGFQSLGALFFNNDLQHYTAAVTSSLFKQKMTVGLRGGLEQTNLSDVQKPKNNRAVISLNVGYQVNNRLSLNGVYSNFDNTTKIRAKEDPTVFVDSLFLAQTTQSASVSSTYQFKNKTNPASLSFTYGHQNAQSIQNDMVNQSGNSTFDNVNVAYTLRLKAIALNTTASINYNLSKFGSMETTTLAPGLSVNKSFFDRKVRSTLHLSYSLLDSDVMPSSQIFNIGWNNSWTIFKNQRLALQLNFTDRTGQQNSAFSELFGSLRYGYQFNAPITGKRKDK